MEKFIQLSVSGISSGAILALVALGFVLIFKSSDVINFAQGELLMVGGYLTYVMLAWLNLPWVIGVPIAIILSALIGILIEHGVLRHLIGEPIISVIMVTVGLSILLRAILGLIFGNAPQQIPEFIPNYPVEIFGARVSADKLWAIVLSFALFILLTLFFRFSKEGIAMRAVADDQQAAMSMGISIKKVWAVAWAIAAMTAAVGGTLLAAIIGGVGLDIAHIGLIVFPVVILGGLDSIPGAVTGGLIVGLLQSYAGGYIDPKLGLAEVVPFIVLVIILLVKPYGLFGTSRIERV
jgi:branched-chain amino acid transport system permease protein